MKHMFILLAIVIAISGCNKKGSGTNAGVSCWACSIEGYYNGTLVDIDTSICNKTQAGINEYMAPHNATEEVVTCTRLTP